MTHSKSEQRSLLVLKVRNLHNGWQQSGKGYMLATDMLQHVPLNHCVYVQTSVVNLMKQ
jgi:hypothetical protein